ncbi:MAG: leucine-rich repeat protein [Eubacterium sp.]|nr:leucine-rich repeat protein [Eubacterium sp.]
MKYYAVGERPWDMFYNVIKFVDFSQTNGLCSTTSDSFKDCASIERVDFTNIREIGWRSFGDCTNLGYIDFDSTLESIWDWAFERNYALDHITFEEGEKPLRIRQYAFYKCKNTTYWLNFPSNLRYIEEGAFSGTKFNYITFSNTEKVEIGDNAFGTGDREFYLRMLGPDGMDIGVNSYVHEMREKYRCNWFYYCKGGNHQYETSTVAPTCTKDGFRRYGCKYCMQNEYKSDFVAKLGHRYQCIGESGGNALYRCAVCGDENYYSSAFELACGFIPAISTVAGDSKFNQANYSSKVDINADGVINAKDFVLIKKAIGNINTDNKETTIDTSRTYQEIEGFGASACWWAQEVGTWENADKIMEMLYSEENGIGLDIIRYNLGAGSEDQKDYGLYNAGARTHCFMKSDGTYDWDNDPGAMNCLDLAVQFNPNLKVTLFSNSAPYFMTKNGKTYSTQDAEGPSNLDSSKYQEFADFTAKCAEHFIDEGYNITEISPINEPEWDWRAWYNGDGSQSHGQEGCHFEWWEARDFYNNYMVPTLKNNPKLNGKVELAVWECAQLNHQWLFNNFIDNLFSSKDYDSLDRWGRKQGEGFASNNANIRSYTNYLDTHSYWCSEYDRHVVADTLSGEFYGQKVKCSEYCQMTNDTNTGVLGHIQNEGSTNGMTIDYGLAMADIMYQDFTILNAVEWDWWTACAKGVYPDNLILINANNHSDVQTSKRYWCLGNFSKFVDVGAKRIQVDTASGFGSDLHTNRVYHWTFHDDNDNISNEGDDKNNYIEQLAFLNPDGSVAIIYINNSDTIEYTRVNNSQFSEFSTYVTSETMDLKNFQNASTDEAICIPARSLTTVVLKN